MIVAGLAVLGVTRPSGPTSEPLGASGTVLVVSVPGLRWQDLVATDTPALDALLRSTGVLSVRAIGAETSPVEAYLTLGAGNRVSADDAGVNLVDGRCIPGVVAEAAASADEELNGAEPGALGDRLAAMGVSTTVHGSPAAIGALMTGDGCVDAYDDAVPTTVGDGVTLVELPGLAATDLAAERAAALTRIDGQLAALAVPDDALVVVVAPYATFERAEVTVVGVRHPASAAGAGAATDAGALVSPTTRRADYVTLADVAPAVLGALERRDDPTADLVLPESMNGTEMRAVSDGVGREAVAREAHLADLAERVLLRDRAVGPVSVVLVVLIALCAFAALGRRARLARTLAPIVVAYPTVTFACGLVAYHQLPLSFVVVMIPVVSAVLAWVSVGSLAKVGRWAPVGALAALLWLVLVVDVCTGSRLQIHTPLGYTPTVAGRFLGYGNLAFGLVGAAAVVTAVAAMHLARPPVPPSWWAGFVGAVTAVAVAAPAFGSDVGGTLAIVPAFAVMVAMIAGVRLGWRRLLAIGAGTVVVVTAVAFLDLARPADARTHLGRFLDELLHGDGGLVVRRKLRGNLAILTSSFWSFVLIGVLVALAAVVWRRRERVLPVVRRLPELRVFLAGFGTVALLGFALNDSGLAVPSIMLSVAVPWLVASLVPVVARAGR